MTSIKDSSPNRHDPGTQTAKDYSQRDNLEQLFSKSPGSYTEKLENFSKYVPRQDLARFLARYELMKKILPLQGSIIECGVQHGGGLMTFANLSAILEPYNFQRRVFGFDTFSGFPKIDENDRKGLKERKSRHLKVGGFGTQGSYDDLLESIRVFNINRPLNHFPKVGVVKGDFLGTGKRFLEDHPHLIVSCLYLDFDLYGPTKHALELFLPRIPKGGIVAFDELNDESFPGESIAALDLLSPLSNYRIERFPFEPRISYITLGD